MASRGTSIAAGRAAAATAGATPAGGAVALAAPGTFLGAMTPGASDGSPRSDCAGVAPGFVFPEDACAASNMWPSGGGTHAAGWGAAVTIVPVAATASCAAVSAAGVEEIAGAGLAGAKVCPSGSGRDGDELSHIGGPDRFAGVSNGEPGATDSIGAAGGGASASAPAGEEFTAAGWGGAPVCGSGCPDGKAELIQNGACGLSSLWGDGAV